jgi:hypothetical protein
MHQTSRSHPVSLWRLHVALRGALLGAILSPVPLQALRQAGRVLIRHICDPPRKRPCHSALARTEPQLQEPQLQQEMRPGR